MLHSVDRDGCVRRLIVKEQALNRNRSVIYAALCCLSELIADLTAIAVNSVTYAVEKFVCFAVYRYFRLIF